MQVEGNPFSRRRFIRAAATAGLATAWERSAAHTIALPFENGERSLVKYPQKRPLIRLTTRPPLLETPFSVFNEGVLTPNVSFTLKPAKQLSLRADYLRFWLADTHDFAYPQSASQRSPAVTEFIRASILSSARNSISSPPTGQRQRG